MRTFLLLLSGVTLGGIIYLINKDRAESGVNNVGENIGVGEDNIGSSLESTKGRNLDSFKKRTDKFNPELEEDSIPNPAASLTNESKTGNVD
jgi:hypothetical protein